MQLSSLIYELSPLFIPAPPKIWKYVQKDVQKYVQKEIIQIHFFYLENSQNFKLLINSLLKISLNSVYIV